MTYRLNRERGHRLPGRVSGATPARILTPGVSPGFPRNVTRKLLTLSLAPAMALLVACNSGSDAADPHTGVFGASVVSGLDYVGPETADGVTDAEGRFRYQQGDVLTFAIGELELGSAEGAPQLTPLSITSDATSASDPRVSNRLVLLQSLDADGDLNNGIQITEAIRAEVSARAQDIDFDQPAADFRASLEPLLEALEGAGAFTDHDPRPRTAVATAAAIEHFDRATRPRTTVATALGQVRGFDANGQAWQFLGVPYARPPVGDLRWRPPQPPEAWEGTRDAIAWPHQAAQNPALQRFGEGSMSEDSLYLHVTTPIDADALPVMVWFHGGGFTSLTGNTKPFNNPEALVSKGVVQVTVNHRLGPFGYIAHPDLSAESGYNGSGNYGQMDLIAALQWVQENIESFGGDPGNVTIFGESGGGRKVLSLMASPEAAGLFHRAISQSGTLYPDTRTLEAAEAIGVQLQENLGAASLEDMRQRPWTEIVSASAELVPYTNIDNHYLPFSERVSFESGNQNDVPFLFLVTANDTPDPINTVRDVFPWLAPLNSSSHYAMLFSHQPAGWRERGVTAYHASELAYLFNFPSSVVTHYLLGLVIDPATGESLEIGDLNGNGVSGSDGDAADIFASAGFDATDAVVIDTMMTIWTNFARTGDPSIPGTLDYPVYDGQAQMYVDLTDTAGIRTGLSDEFPAD